MPPQRLMYALCTACRWMPCCCRKLAERKKVRKSKIHANARFSWIFDRPVAV